MVKDITAAINTIFPDGRGGTAKHLASREVFQADDVTTEPEDQEDLQAAMDIMAKDIAERHGTRKT